MFICLHRKCMIELRDNNLNIHPSKWLFVETSGQCMFRVSLTACWKLLCSLYSWQQCVILGWHCSHEVCKKKVKKKGTYLFCSPSMKCHSETDFALAATSWPAPSLEGSIEVSPAVCSTIDNLSQVDSKQVSEWVSDHRGNLSLDRGKQSGQTCCDLRSRKTSLLLFKLVCLRRLWNAMSHVMCCLLWRINFI